MVRNAAAFMDNGWTMDDVGAANSQASILH